MMASFGRGGVEECQTVFTVGCFYPDDAGLTNRFRQSGAGCRVFRPGFPQSFVVHTDREPPLSSRIFSMREPSVSSTTWASVVLGFAPVPICQVFPLSLLYTMVECGT